MSSDFLADYNNFGPYIVSFCRSSEVVNINLPGQNFFEQYEYYAMLVLNDHSDIQIDRILWAIDRNIISRYIEESTYQPTSKAVANKYNIKWLQSLANTRLDEGDVVDIQLSEDAQRAIDEELASLNALNKSNILSEGRIYPAMHHIITLNGARAEKQTPEAAFGLPGVSWPECYAAVLLAYALVPQNLRRLDLESAFGRQHSEYEFNDLVCDFLAHATEIQTLLTMTELSKGYPELSNPLAIQAGLAGKRKQASNAARIRHEPVRDIKESFFNWWKESKGKPEVRNRTIAAEYYYDNLMTKEQQEKVSSETLRKFIGARLSGKA